MLERWREECSLRCQRTWDKDGSRYKLESWRGWLRGRLSRHDIHSQLPVVMACSERREVVLFVIDLKLIRPAHTFRQRTSDESVEVLGRFGQRGRRWGPIADKVGRGIEWLGPQVLIIVSMAQLCLLLYVQVMVAKFQEPCRFSRSHLDLLGHHASRTPLPPSAAITHHLWYTHLRRKPWRTQRHDRNSKRGCRALSIEFVTLL